MQTPRNTLIQEIADRIARIPSSGPLRVAIDGVDGAGKTTFADELAAILTWVARPVIRAAVDSFHNPRSVRYRQGPSSPRGFFDDSYNYSELRSVLLEPLSPGGNLRYRRAIFDHRTDCPVESPLEEATIDSILILDGIFLHRPELLAYWDFSIFLRVDFKVSIPRGAQRGEGSPDPLSATNHRYVQGQRIYLAECNPIAATKITIDNNDLDRPYVVDDVGALASPPSARPR